MIIRVSMMSLSEYRVEIVIELVCNFGRIINNMAVHRYLGECFARVAQVPPESIRVSFQEVRE